jgi:hydroxymethylglutaryl-CoA lyase
MSMKWPANIIFCEVGPRDGLQNEAAMLSVEQKIELIEGVAEAGVPIVEVGSFVNPKAVPQMADTDLVAKRIRRMPGVEYRCLVANKKGVERAVDAGISKVKLTLSASESHAKANLNKTISELLDGFTECVSYAREKGAEVSGAISTAFGCPFEGKIPVSSLVDITSRFISLGITELSLSDTTGMANPRQVYDTVSLMQDKFPDVRWFLHFHNTRGMALANIIAGLNAGVIRYDASLAGLGGCPYAPGASGNVASEDVLHMLGEMGISTGVDLDMMIALAKRLKQWVGHPTDSFVLKAGKVSDLVAITAAKKQPK